MEDKDINKELEETDQLASIPGLEQTPLKDTIEESFKTQDLREEADNQGASVETFEDSFNSEDSLVNTDSEENENIQQMITVRPVKFQKFQPDEPNRAIKKNLDIMQDVSMHVSVELGRTKATIKDVMDYKEGSIVELDKIAGEQVEVYVNNKLVAKGEVIVIEDKFGVRVTTTSLPKGI